MHLFHRARRNRGNSTQDKTMIYGMSFASSLDAPRQAQMAEELGFSYIGFYDYPSRWEQTSG
jgi:hypothetical protein